MAVPGPIERISLARRAHDPLRAVATRVVVASALVLFIAVVVRLGGDGWIDVTGDPITILDALYYASVTVTTTGYGDITAVTSGTRLATLLLITPARILFLILVVGTTVEVLTEQYRQLLRTRRWRDRVEDHYIICGYGSTGRAAVEALRADGISPDEIVVIDTDRQQVDRATVRGLTAIHGDAARVDVQEQAATATARSVIVTPNRDDAATLITLTAREANPRAHIVAAVRERENQHLLEQSGANAVIDASSAVGRLLGLATRSPSTLTLVDDLLDVGRSLELDDVAPVRDGKHLVAPAGTSLIEVVRRGERLTPDDAGDLHNEDRLIVVRRTTRKP